MDRELTDKTKDFMRRPLKAGKPFFAYVPYNFPAGKILTDHIVSLKRYPPVPPGAADQYVPAAPAIDANAREPTIEGND